MANGVLKVRIGGAWQAIMNGVQSLLQSFVTFNSEPSLTGARRLTAGTNVTLDTATAGEIRINATSGSGGRGFEVIGGTPYFGWRDTSQPSGSQVFIAQNVGQKLTFSSMNDDYTAYTAANTISISRNAVVNINGVLEAGPSVGGIVSGDISCNRGSGTGAIYFGASTNYIYYASDVFNFSKGASINGVLNVTGAITGAGITANGNIQNNGGFIYPGRVDSGGAFQGSWYLASHASYGLYSNTGLNLAGNLWANAVYASNIPSYSEGTWSPYLNSDSGLSGITYGLQEGYYKKINNLVYVQGFIGLTARGTGAGNLYVGGLPFPFANVSSAYSGLNVNYYEQMGVHTASLGLRGVPGNGHMYLVASIGTVTLSSTYFDVTNIQNNFAISFNGCYMI